MYGKLTEVLSRESCRVGAVRSNAGSDSTPKSNMLNFITHSYKWRWFGSKGLIIVLFWSFSVFSFLNYILRVYVESPTVTYRYSYLVCVSVVGGFFPVIGWLTDVYVGRYRAIKTSLFVLWCGAVSWCLLDLLQLTFILYHPIYHYLALCNAVLVSLALGCFMVNAIQFSVDQLLDSSSNEIISYISWLIWVYFVSKLFAGLQVCIGASAILISLFQLF